MFLLLFTLENDHSDVRILLGLGQLLLDLAHEFNVDVDLFVRCKLALHGRDREHLLCQSLLHAEVETDWVLTLVFKVEGQLLGLTDSDSSEVKFSHHGLV